MYRVILSLALVCISGLTFAQQTNTPAVVTEAKKYPEAIKISALTRLAVRWDINTNFAVVPYVMYAFIKNGITKTEPLAFRLRMDCTF